MREWLFQLIITTSVLRQQLLKTLSDILSPTRLFQDLVWKKLLFNYYSYTASTEPDFYYIRDYMLQLS